MTPKQRIAQRIQAANKLRPSYRPALSDPDRTAIKDAARKLRPGQTFVTPEPKLGGRRH